MRDPVARLRDARRRARQTLGDLRPARSTALRIPPGRISPPPSAFARFGTGSWIVPPAEVEGAAAIEVGDGVIILELSSLLVADDRGARLVLGDGTRLARAVHVVCSTSVEIGPGVSSSDHATVTDSWALLAPRQGPVPPPPPAPVIIESGAYLGFGCIVGPGVRVGEGAFVGEGAVVLDDVEPHSVVYGNPAAPVRRYDRAAACWTERQLL